MSTEYKLSYTATEIDEALGTVDVLEGRMTTVEGAVATKVEQEAYNAKVEALEGEDTAIKGRLDDIESVLGEGGNVADQIATAKAEAIAKATTDATTKANTAETNAKAYANTEVAKVETRVEALETASATHALKTDVKAVAGNVDTLEADMTQAKTDIDAVEAKAQANETAISTLQTDIATKATTADLKAESTRAQQKEAELDEKLGTVDENKERIDSLETQVGLCFQSVSNGKSLVASAITGKGVTTDSDATFETMASNISAIPKGKCIYLGTGTSFDVKTVCEENGIDYTTLDSDVNFIVGASSIPKTVTKQSDSPVNGYAAFAINIQANGCTLVKTYANGILTITGTSQQIRTKYIGYSEPTAEIVHNFKQTVTPFAYLIYTG